MRRAWLPLLLVACSPGAVGPRARGEPLFTVKGQLVTSGLVPTRPIRLALAWYPDAQAASAPRAIVTQDVAYEGSFPLNYSFSFFTPPPEGVLSEYMEAGQTTRAAFGVLMAYDDLNENGRLDTIAPDGGPIDRVLGTSVGDTYNAAPAAAPVWVAYVEGTPPSSWAGYGPGYNLWRNGAVAEPSTAVPIALDGTNELNLLVCEEFISGASFGYDLPCSLPPTGGVRVIGNVYQRNGEPGVSLRITDGARVLPGLRVTLNDAGVPFDAPSGLYGGALAAPLAAPGVNTLEVAAPGQAPLVFRLVAPGDFALQAPGEGARLLSGTELTTQWTASTGAAFYQTHGYALTPPHAPLKAVVVTPRGESSFTAALTGFETDDTWEVSVAAFARGYLAYGRGGSLVNLSVSRVAYVDVRPADVGAWLEGSVSVSSYQGQTGGSAWVQGFVGVTPVTDALVTVGGAPLGFDRRSQHYGGAADVFPGDTAVLGITARGQMTKRFEVALPEDFTLTAPPPTHPRGQPLTLTWSPSPGASDYRVWVTDVTGRQLHFWRGLETTATVPALDLTGAVIVTVAAAKQGASRHLVGLVQKSVDVDLVP